MDSILCPLRNRGQAAVPRDHGFVLLSCLALVFVIGIVFSRPVQSGFQGTVEL